MDLPYSSAAELAAFLRDGSARALGMSRADIVGALVRRRRQSIEHRLEDPYEGAYTAEQLRSGDIATTAGLLSQQPPTLAGSMGACHVVVLGDDACAGKQRLVADYVRRADPLTAGAHTAAFAPTAHANERAAGPSAAPLPLEARITRPVVGTPLVALCPPSDDACAALRQEMLRAAQCVLLVFSVARPDTLASCQRRWAAEVASAQAEVGHRIPIVLVGCDAELRATLSASPIQHNTPQAPSREGSVSPTPHEPTLVSTAAGHASTVVSLVSSEAAVKAAQTLRASKYVEVHAGNSSHAFELFCQALRVAGPPHRPTTAAARAALCEALRCPMPIARYDPRRGGVVVVGDANDDASVTASASLQHSLQHQGEGAGSSDEGIPPQFEGRQIVGTWDGTDPRTSPTAFVVPEDGFIALPSALTNPSRRPNNNHSSSASLALVDVSTVGGVARSSAAPQYKSLLLAARARSLYVSEVAEVLLPRLAPTPRAWFNTVAKTCEVVTSLAAYAFAYDASASDSAAGLRSTTAPPPGVTYRYTLDGSEPNEYSTIYSGPIRLDDSLAMVGGAASAEGISTPFCMASAVGMHAALDRPYAATPSFVAADGGGGGGGSSALVAAVGPRVIRVRAYVHGGGYFLPSAVADFPVPAVIETPKASYSPADGLLTISNAQPLLYEYRYTLDGSVPTASAEAAASIAAAPHAISHTYTRPVLVSAVAAGSAVRQIRVAAFPRQWLPSEEVIVDVGGTAVGGGGAAATAASRKPHVIIGATRASGMRAAAAAATAAAQHTDPNSAASSVNGGAAGGRLFGPTASSAAKKATPTRRGRSPSNSNASAHYGGGGSPSGLDSPQAKGRGAAVVRRGVGGSPSAPQRFTRTGSANGRSASGAIASSPSKGRGVPREWDSNGRIRRDAADDVSAAYRSAPSRFTRAAAVRTAADGRPPSRSHSGSADRTYDHDDSVAVDVGAKHTHSFAVGSKPPQQRIVTSSPSRREALLSGSASGPRPRTTSATRQAPKPHHAYPSASASPASVTIPTAADVDAAAPSASPPSARHSRAPLPPAAPACRSDGNTVYFDFPIPIALSHITITTPGRARGPDAYEVLVRTREGSAPISVGMGDLQDLEGVQTMHVVSAARGMDLCQVVCRLSGPDGFDVLDMKVHGKPRAGAGGH